MKSVAVRAETEQCSPNTQMERKMGVKGGGKMGNKSCKFSHITVKIVHNLILSEEFFLISKRGDNLQLSFEGISYLSHSDGEQQLTLHKSPNS